MSFGAGMGAGMGAGIGAGIAIGISSGRKRACDDLREYLETKGLTIRDRQGHEIDAETILADMGQDKTCSTRKSNSTQLMLALGLAVAVLVGLIVVFLVVQ